MDLRHTSKPNGTSFTGNVENTAKADHIFHTLIGFECKLCITYNCPEFLQSRQGSRPPVNYLMAISQARRRLINGVGFSRSLPS